MKISAFLKAILPRLQKDTLAEDLRVSIDELDKIAIPGYHSAVPFFKTYKIASPDTEQLSSLFRSNYKSKLPKQANFIADIGLALPNLRANAEYILGQAEQVLSEDILNEGLTAKKALLVRSAEMISFAVRYSIDLLNLVYECESKKLSDDEVYDSIKLPPVRRNLTLKHITNFGSILADYGQDPKKFSSLISDVPEIFVNSKNASSLAAVYKETEIDPFANSYAVGFSGSPIYHLRLIIAEWQANRYKANKDKKTVLELRLLYLKTQSEDGKGDAKLEREIEYTQNRINKIERYLDSVEQDLEA